MSWRWTGLTGALTVLGAVLFSASPVARADAIAVDCGAGEHVQAAIDQARPGDTVVVSGFCDEHVTVREEAARITLDGQGTATIHGPNPALAVITVLGRGITVRGFTLTGGEEGIVVWRGGTALIDGNTIQDTTTIPGSTQGGQGINVAQHSYAVVLNNTIQSNPTQGIVVHEGSFARIGVQNPADPTPRGNVIRNNGPGGGIRVQRASGVRIAQNTISDNAGPGVYIAATSHASLGANRIDGNAGDGVTVTQNSSVQLGGDIGVLSPPNETQAPNSGFGIRCALNSSADGRLATLTGTAGARGFDSSCTDNLAP